VKHRNRPAAGHVAPRATTSRAGSSAGGDHAAGGPAPEPPRGIDLDLSAGPADDDSAFERY
jgi:hypothetical protein